MMIRSYLSCMGCICYTGHTHIPRSRPLSPCDDVTYVTIRPIHSGCVLGLGGYLRTNNHATRAVEPQTTAPMATVHGTPIQCETAPASKPPKGIMPPNISAQMPMTRPRIPSATLV